MLRSLRILPVAAAIAFGSLTGVQASCAGGHVQAMLADFPSEAVSRPFYWADEGDGQVTFVLRALGDDCTPSAITISYQTKDGTATSADYLPNSGSRVVTTDPTHGPNDRQPVPVTTLNDPVPETVVESALAEITGVQGGGHVSEPKTAALHIVDDDGPGRISLDPGTEYRQVETYNLAGVPVFRGGLANTEAKVSYTIEPGEGSPKAGEDYRAESGQLTFAAGDRVEMIPITLINDRDTEPEERLTITLTTIEGAILEGEASTTFTILDNEELGGPTSLFHHPKNKFKYRAKDYRIREIHVFTQDAGSGVVGAEMAVRRNLKGGGCSWLNGNKWKKGSCSEERWLKMEKQETDFYFLRMPELAPSRGKIKDYTALSRAIDGAGNREDRFEPGRNANTFEIK